jgi:hypothetical protein
MTAVPQKILPEEAPDTRHNCYCEPLAFLAIFAALHYIQSLSASGRLVA